MIRSAIRSVWANAEQLTVGNPGRPLRGAALSGGNPNKLEPA